MQYTQRRIQRVSGVIVRDERIVSRDYSIQPSQPSRWENWDNLSVERLDRSAPNREVRAFNKQDMCFRERT